MQNGLKNTERDFERRHSRGRQTGWCGGPPARRRRAALPEPNPTPRRDHGSSRPGSWRSVDVPHSPCPHPVPAMNTDEPCQRECPYHMTLAHLSPIIRAELDRLHASYRDSVCEVTIERYRCTEARERGAARAHLRIERGDGAHQCEPRPRHRPARDLRQRTRTDRRALRRHRHHRRDGAAAGIRHLRLLARGAPTARGVGPTGRGCSSTFPRPSPARCVLRTCPPSCARSASPPSWCPRGPSRARRCGVGAFTSATSTSSKRTAERSSRARTRRYCCCSHRRRRRRSPTRAHTATSSARAPTSRHWSRPRRSASWSSMPRPAAWCRSTARRNALSGACATRVAPSRSCSR